jgi:hypothetical protein
MRQWSESRPENATYRSHDIPGEFLEAIHEHVQESIASCINPKNMSVPFIAVMADEATDLARRTNLSVCVRFLTPQGDPVEFLLGWWSFRAQNQSQ